MTKAPKPVSKAAAATPTAPIVTTTAAPDRARNPDAPIVKADLAAPDPLAVRDPFALAEETPAVMDPSVPEVVVEDFGAANPALTPTLAKEPTSIPVHPDDVTIEPEAVKRKPSKRRPPVGFPVQYRHSIALNGSDVMAAIVTGVPEDEAAPISLRVFPPMGEPFNVSAFEEGTGPEDETKVWRVPSGV